MDHTDSSVIKREDMDDETELLNAWNGLLHGKEEELGELLKRTDVRNAMLFHCFHFYNLLSALHYFSQQGDITIRYH